MKLLDVINSPWAILPEKLEEIREIYITHLRGDKIDIKAIEAQLLIPLNNKRKDMEIQNGVAVIELDGVLAKKMNLFMDISGGTSTQIIGNQIRAALADDDVTAIVLNIDSPGGTVDGTAELADLIFQSRGDKPIVAFVDGLMASAAFWIGSAADRILISGDTAMVGSVGVIATHVDQSRFNEMKGVKVTHIVSGKFKAVGSPHMPLNENGLKTIQDEVNAIMSVFVAKVAEFRGVSEEAIRETLGEAQILMGQQALAAGVVDGVSTLDRLISELSQSDGDSPAGRETSNLEQGGFMNDATKKAPEISAEYLKSEYPGVYQEIFDKGAAVGMEHGQDKGVALGAKAERERILAVKEQALPGEEKLVEEMMFDGKTTGPEAAVKILQNQKAKLANQSTALAADSAEPVDDAVPPAGDPDLSGLPLEERCKAEWQNDTKIREEYVTFEDYIAYEKANAAGQVKVLSK